MDNNIAEEGRTLSEVFAAADQRMWISDVAEPEPEVDEVAADERAFRLAQAGHVSRSVGDVLKRALRSQERDDSVEPVKQEIAELAQLGDGPTVEDVLQRARRQMAVEDAREPHVTDRFNEYEVLTGKPQGAAPANAPTQAAPAWGADPNVETAARKIARELGVTVEQLTDVR